MNFASSVAANQKIKLANTIRDAGQGKTPEALLAYLSDQIVTAPQDSSVTAEFNNYLRSTGAWTGSDAQLQAKSAGLVHLMVGSPEYQLV